MGGDVECVFVVLGRERGCAREDADGGYGYGGVGLHGHGEDMGER